jgi:hypothetical protein
LGYTHTCVAIRDALAMLDFPVIEVHLSKIHEREKFRHQSMIADIVADRVTGFGSQNLRAGIGRIGRDDLTIFGVLFRQQVSHIELPLYYHLRSRDLYLKGSLRPLVGSLDCTYSRGVNWWFTEAEPST